MSCKNKLSNLPILSNINEQFKKLAPSNLEGLSSKLKAQKIAEGFGDMAGDLTKQIGTQIGNFANDATGKLSNLGGLVSGLGADLKAGIPEDLKGIKTSIANSITSAKDQISKQYQNMKSAFDCEDGVTSESLSSTQETTKLKSAVMATSVSSTKDLSNKDIKNVTENNDYKNQKTQEVTNNTISKGQSIASDSQSNKGVVTTQTKSLSALQTVSSPQDDKFEKDTGKLYKVSTSLLKDVQTGGSYLIIESKGKAYTELDDIYTKSRILVRSYKLSEENVNILDKLYTQNELDLDNAKFNLELNNLQLTLIKFAIQKINNTLPSTSIAIDNDDSLGTMTSEAYIKNTNKILQERLTLIQKGESKTPPNKIVINLIKGSIL